MKKSLIITVALVMCLSGLNSYVSASEWIKTFENAKTSVYGDRQYQNIKFSYPRAVKSSMELATCFTGCRYEVSHYSRKDIKKSSDFADDYIYGEAFKALNEAKYGLVELNYFVFDDEYKNEAGWDTIYLFKLEDESVLCVKIIKHENIYTGQSCTLDKDKNALVLKESSYGHVLTVYLNDSTIKEGYHQYLGSNGESELEGSVLMGSVLKPIKTKLFIKNKDNAFEVRGSAVIYNDDGVTQSPNHFTYHYEGTLTVSGD